MSYHSIHKALAQAFSDLLAGAPVGIAWPNQPYKNDEDGLWVQFDIIHAGAEPVTLGENGEDEAQGILQLTINRMTNEGVGLLYQMADAFKALFVAGKRFTDGTTEVVVTSFGITPLSLQDKHFQLAVEVGWYARMNRPNL
jgi:hypothetical protein